MFHSVLGIVSLRCFTWLETQWTISPAGRSHRDSAKRKMDTNLVLWFIRPEAYGKINIEEYERNHCVYNT